MAGSETQELVLKITADTSDAEASIKRIQTAVSGIGTTVGQTSGTSQLNQQLQQTAQSANVAGTAIGVAFGGVALQAINAVTAAISGLPSQLADLAQQGAAVQHATDAFTNLSEGIGVLSSQYLPALQVASQGFISNLDLMRLGSKALLEGGAIPKSGDTEESTCLG